VSRINASAGDAAGIVVDDETARLLDYAAAAHAQSAGLFDITSGVLRRAWDFRRARLPAPGELEALLPLVGWPRVRWEPPRITLPIAGQELDFGGFGKEYAVDCLAAVLLRHGIRHGLVELGGDLRAIGPQPDGSPWRVGISHPRKPTEAIAQIELPLGALATSGDYERYFELGGRRYCHILDPRSGWPAQGCAGVSVVADQCLVAGSVATIAMLKGAQAREWLEGAGLPWLIVSAEGRIAGTVATRVK
jgi:FAD:protein FMN transferase